MGRPLQPGLLAISRKFDRAVTPRVSARMGFDSWPVELLANA